MCDEDTGEIFLSELKVVELNFNAKDTAECVEHFGGREVKFLAEDFGKEGAFAAAGFEEFGGRVADSGLNFRNGEAAIIRSAVFLCGANSSDSSLPSRTGC